MSNREIIRTEAGALGTSSAPSDEGVARILPVADVIEEAEGYRVELEMPGVDPSAIDVSYEQGTLLVRAAAPKPAPAGARPVLLERGRGDYVRAFNVTDSIDPDRIEADYRLGVLTLTLPKAEAAKPKRIQVHCR
jgi:HSP20 family protein